MTYIPFSQFVLTGYLLSKKEQRPGSPEKPLSALGALGYRNYWTLALMRYLQTAPDDPSLEGQFCFFWILLRS